MYVCSIATWKELFHKRFINIRHELGNFQTFQPIIKNFMIKKITE